MIAACDIGTSSIKLGIIDHTGTLVWFAQEPVTITVRGTDAASWKRAVCRITKRMASEFRNRIVSVCISGNGPTLIPLGRKGEPIAPPLIWYEERKRQELPFPSASYYLPKVLWFAREHPALYEKTICFIPPGEYIASFLTGNQCTILPHKGYEPYYWIESEIAGLKLDKCKFAPFLLLGNEVGKVTAEAARISGFRMGISVYSTGPDFLMALLGTGAITPGNTNDRGGTSEAVNYCTNKPLSSDSLRMVPGLLEGTYNVSGFVRNAGKFHHWLKEKLVGPRGTYEDFATLANDVIPGISQLRFIPPELSGGTFKNRLNVNDAFIGMTGETSRGEMVLAFFEYVCFALRRLFEEFSSHAAMIGNVRSSGGLSKCATFNQLKATMIGKTISVSAVEDAELVGNAIVACVAAGEYRDYHEAVYALVRFKTDFVPDATLRTLYDELFEEYKKSPESSHR